MDSLQFFIEQLYDQPSVEEERIAWRAILLGEGAPLWSHCLALAGNPDGRSLLDRLWQRFLDPRAEKQVAAFAPHLPAEALLKSARQLVAASVVAHLCLHESTGQNAALATELRQWAQRAVAGQEVPALLADLPNHSPLHNWIECPVERVLQVYDLWDDSARGEGWVAARHASCHIVRQNLPSASRRQSVTDRKAALRVPILLDCRDGKGAVIWLCLQQGEAGRGFAHDLSDSMRCLDTTFLDSLRKVADLVWRRYVTEWDKDVVWWLDDLPANVSLQGESAMGATGVGLLHLLRGLPYDPQYVVSTTVSESDLRLGKVTGFEGPKYPKMAAAQNELARGQTITILLHRESFTAHGVPAEFPNVRVAHPGDLHEAFEICTALSGGVLRYLRGVVACPDGPGIQLALGGRTLAQLYVFPDFLRSELRPDPENGRGDSTDDKPKERAQVDIEEQSLFLERVREVEKRLTWEETRKALDAPGRRAVLLASPGQGKTAWTVMAARELAAQSAEMLVSGTRHDRVVVPLAVALKDLLEGVSIGGRDNAAAVLRGRLRELIRGSAPDLHAVAVEEVVTGVLSERGWLFLDGLDEVSTSSVATLTKFLDVLKTRPCRVVIASRPYGYKEWRATLQLLFSNPEEYRLAPQNYEQQKQLVGNFYGDKVPDNRERMKYLLLRNPAAIAMSQNPFLLTLLCAIVDQIEPPNSVTRTQLYDWGVRYMLGGKRRAGVWMPLLREIAAALFKQDERTLTISEETLLDLIQTSDNRPTLESANGSFTPRQQAEAVLKELYYCRLLVRVGPQVSLVTFAHRTVGEFLMGSYLARLMEPQSTPRVSEAEPPGARESFVSKIMHGIKNVIAFIKNVRAFNCIRLLRSHRLSGPLGLIDVVSWRREWELVVVFLAGQLNHPGPLLNLLADESRDDVLRHRLGLAGQCLAELQPQAREAMSKRITQITTWVFGLWGGFAENGVEAAVPHLARALPSIVTVNGQVAWDFSRKGVSEPLGVFVSNLVQEQSDTFPMWVIRGLGQLGSAVAEDHILTLLAQLLKHQDEHVRREATEAVGMLGEAAARDDILDQLVRLLQDESFFTRRTTIEAVGRMGPSAARNDLFLQLTHLRRDKDCEIRIAATDAVIRLEHATARENCFTSLVDLLQHGHFAHFDPILALVEKHRAAFECDDALALLARLLEDQQVREQAVKAVGRIGAAAARDDFLSRLARLLEHQNEAVRASVVEVVKVLGSAAARDAFLTQLSALIQDQDAAIRHAAVEAVRAIGTAAARDGFLGLLHHLLAHQDVMVQRAAVTVVGELGPSAVRQDVLNQLSKLLQNQEPVKSLLFATVKAVGMMGADAAREDILTALALLFEVDDHFLRLAVVEAFARMGKAANRTGMISQLIRVCHQEHFFAKQVAKLNLTFFQ